MAVSEEEQSSGLQMNESSFAQGGLLWLAWLIDLITCPERSQQSSSPLSQIPLPSFLLCYATFRSLHWTIQSKYSNVSSFLKLRSKKRLMSWSVADWLQAAWEQSAFRRLAGLMAPHRHPAGPLGPEANISFRCADFHSCSGETKQDLPSHSCSEKRGPILTMVGKKKKVPHLVNIFHLLCHQLEFWTS